MKEFKLIKHIETITENYSTSTEFNIIQWFDNDPKYDIRKWKSDDPKKGISLTEEELRKLYKAIQN